MDIKSIKKGSILIARPSLNSDIFNRSVVLITNHSQEGTMGVIINKPTKTPLDFFDKLFLYNGGPLGDNELFFFHRRPDLITKNIHIANDIYWAQDYDEIFQIKNISINDFILISGYAGWEKQQLETEVKNNEWNVINNHNIEIFEKLDHKVWIDLMKKIGGENLIWLNTPSDPSMN